MVSARQVVRLLQTTADHQSTIKELEEDTQQKQERRRVSHFQTATGVAAASCLSSTSAVCARRRVCVWRRRCMTSRMAMGTLIRAELENEE